MKTNNMVKFLPDVAVKYIHHVFFKKRCETGIIIDVGMDEMQVIYLSAKGFLAIFGCET